MRVKKLRAAFCRITGIAELYQLKVVRQHARRLFYRLAGFPPKEYLALSSRCNARCIFCPYPVIADGGKPLETMSDDVFDAALAALERGGGDISFTPPTGEVFADPQWDERVARALMLPNVKWAHFYTNGIALNAKNRAKLLALPNREKLTVSLSTGGIDRESYNELYGVDKFDQVQRNVQALAGELKSRNDNLAIHIEVRLSKRHTKVKVKDLAPIYNAVGYAHIGINILRTYDSAGGLVDPDVLELNDPIDKDFRPCLRLGNTAFLPDGSVSACGCFVTDQPGRSSDLAIGKVWDDAYALNRRRQSLISGWRKRNDIPEVCRSCTIYVPQGRWSHLPLYAKGRNNAKALRQGSEAPRA